jgi:hypothetical protein
MGVRFWFFKGGYRITHLQEEAAERDECKKGFQDVLRTLFGVETMLEQHLKMFLTLQTVKG